MFRRPFRVWSWKLGLALLALLFAWAWWMVQPLSTLVLPDGTKLYLRRVSFGKVHRYKTPSQPGATLWQRIQRLLGPPNGMMTMNDDGPVFHFTTGLAGSIEETGAPIQAIRTFWDGDRVIEAKFNKGGPITFWREPVFPRRERTFRAQVNVGGTWHDWELPNPTFGQTFPEWKAETLPITRTFGDIEYTTQGWKRGNFGWYFKYELSYKGKPIKWPVVSASSTIYSDPTGNRSHSLLSASDPAWLVRQEITTGKQAPLSPDHLISLATFLVPKTSEQVMQPVPPEKPLSSAKFFGYAGPGRYLFTDGVPTPVSSSIKGSNERRCTLSVTPDGKSWTLGGFIDSPAFLLIEESTATTPNSPPFPFESRYLSEGKEKSLWASEHADQNVNGRKIGVRLFTLPEPIGTPVEVQFYRTETFTVEMYVKPPPPTPGNETSTRR